MIEINDKEIREGKNKPQTWSYAESLAASILDPNGKYIKNYEKKACDEICRILYSQMSCEKISDVENYELLELKAVITYTDGEFPDIDHTQTFKDKINGFLMSHSNQR